MGAAQSESVVIEDGSNVYLTLDGLTPDLEDELMDKVNTFATQWAEAYRTLDEETFSYVTPDYKDFKRNNLQTMKEGERVWEGELRQTEFDPDSFYLTQDNHDGYVAGMRTALHYDSASYVQGDEAPETTENSMYWDFTFIYDEQLEEWLVTYTQDYMSAYFSSTDAIQFDF